MYVFINKSQCKSCPTKDYIVSSIQIIVTVDVKKCYVV